MERLLIASTFLPPTVGGRERVVWELAKRLVRNFEVHIIATESGRIGAGEQIGAEIHWVPRLPVLTLAYSSIANHRVKRIAAEVSPDIIHSHQALPWGYVFRRENRKKVVTCHGSDVYPNKRYPARFFVMSGLNSADSITVPSRWLSTFVQENYGVKPMVIPNGVDTEMFRPLQGIQPEDNVVLYVGRFLERKGILDLIRAAKVLPEYEFWLVGGSTVTPVKFPPLPNVKVIGPLVHPELVLRYARACICVFPSHAENFPMVGLEAMACGKPIVATELGFSEYIEDGREGMLVKPRDVEGLVRSIRHLMGDYEERKRLGENARRKALRYDWSVITGQYVKLYESI
jgi:glycosyltransferase involved in cell wall biosynthesis